MTAHERRAHDEKMKFSCRKDAKLFARRGHLKGIHAYPCATCGYWHLGHLPHDVRYGTAVGSYAPLPVGSSHTVLHSTTEARRLAARLIDDGWADIIGPRVAARIAYIQRAENRHPALTEAAEFGDEFWAAVSDRPDTWDSGDRDWRESVTNATMSLLARLNWITLDSRGREVRIGYQFTRAMQTA